MLLSDIPWHKTSGELHAQIACGKRWLYISLQGDMYDIYYQAESPFHVVGEFWAKVDAITAQAILFHLTSEVTTHPTKENENEA